MGGRGSSSTSAVARTSGRVASNGQLRSAFSGVATLGRIDHEGNAVSFTGTLKEGGELGVTLGREGGQLVATVDGLYAKSTGAGAGTRAMNGVENAARSLGASELRLTAGQVGTYAWAKSGFQWSPATGARMESAYRGWLGAHGHDVSVASGTGSSPRAMATSRHGKAFLLSESAPNWSGFKKL